MRASKPCARTAAAMRSSSVATHTERAPLAAARSHTRAIIGLPPRSASGLPGNRLEA
jgi:hypothetical protein